VLCARYGELDELVELWGAGSVRVDACDANGSSALHMACANGHDKVAQWLLEHGARCFANAAGNSPLHWALLNKQVGCTKELLRPGCVGVDVLSRNAQGKTCVTLAFDSGNTELLQLVLEHPSANKLNTDGSVAAPDQRSDLELEADGEAEPPQPPAAAAAAAGSVEGAAGSQPGAEEPQQEMTSVATYRGIEVRVREVGFFADGGSRLAASRADLETTGAVLWAASLVLSSWVAGRAEQLRGKRVVELGAGCALPGLVAAWCTEAAAVTVTDLPSRTFANTMHNVALNGGGAPGARLRGAALDWTQPTSWPQDCVGRTDVLIGSDLVYDLDLVLPLVAVVSALLPAAGGVFFYVSANDDRAGLSEFIAALEAAGLRKEQRLAPLEYCQDPFVESQETFAIRFPEFDSTTFTLYEFSRP
jgi:predicted nicotinamide N-methyase